MLLPSFPTPTPSIILAIAVLWSALAGCATTSSPIYGVVGDDPSRVTLDVRGSVVLLRGKAATVAEIGRVPGGRIAVLGSIQRAAIRVSSWELVEGADGMPAHVGRLVVDQSGVALLDETVGNAVALRGTAVPELKRAHGARVWLTGTFVGVQTLLVHNWGVLRDPS